MTLKGKENAMMRKLWKSLTIPFALLGLLALGCGEGGKEASDVDDTEPTVDYGADAEGNAFVGAPVCINCHEGFSWSEEVVAKYLEGRHVVHSTHVDASMEECLRCHDPVGDGKELGAYLLSNGLIADILVPDAGLAAVTCEACHGGGGKHFGSGPMPIARPGPETCGGAGAKCHSSLPEDEHRVFHPEGNDIFAKYAASNHAEGEVRNEAKCVKCHTDEGGKLYKDVVTAEGLELLAQPLETVSAIQCRTCHDPHNPGGLLKGETEDDGEVLASAEYNTCVNCHQAPDADLGDPPPFTDTEDGAAGELIYHAKRYSRVIADTHFDDPATDELIEGYVVAPGSDRACRDCHDVHSGDLTINEQWAQSGHAGSLGPAKQAVADTPPEGWTGSLRDWQRSTQVIAALQAMGTESSWTADPWPHDDEAECQRCHTATGAKNFLTAPGLYYDAMDAFIAAYEDGDPDTNAENPNDFSYLQPEQRELLYCWACHSDNAGGLRNPGTVPLQDRNGEVFATLPNAGDSNVCGGCHGGRANGEYVRNLAAGSRSTSARVHHAVAAGTLFSESTHTGYEFDLDDDGDAAEHYQNLPYFAHDEIGLEDGLVPSGAGPCVSCHMPGADHEWEILREDDEEVTIASQALCDTCHAEPYLMNPTILEEAATAFEQAVDFLGTFLTDNFTGLDLTTSGNVPSKDVPAAGVRGADVDSYGAQQNYRYLSGEDDGAYAHNNNYAKLLIFDSIDWLDDGAFDGTITIPAEYPAARSWYGAGEDGVALRPGSDN